MLDNLVSYVGYVVAALGGTNAVAPVWPWRSDKQLHSLSPLYNALFIALYFLCTMRYLSLTVSFVQCVIYRSLSPLYNALFSDRVGSDDIRPGEDQLCRQSTPRGSTLPTIHLAAASIYSLPFLYIHFFL